MVPFVQRAILLAAVGAVISPSPLSVLQLVERLEEEEVALVFECLGNLLPCLFDAVLDGVIDNVVVGGFLDLKPVFIVVRVEDDIEPCCLGPFHVLLDLGHVVGLYRPCFRVLIVTPSDTDADRACTSFL